MLVCQCSTAHEYYLKYDVNPTLVRILTDMCDIYMTSYLDCEPEVVSELNCIRDLIDSGAKSATQTQTETDTQTQTESRERDRDRHRDTTCPTHLLPQCTNESITSLLGGALKVLLDCRFAMTEAVVSRYPHEMALLAVQVAGHLQQLLLKLLRILKLLPTATATATTEAESLSERQREECVQTTKLQYSLLLLGLTSAGTSTLTLGASSSSSSSTGDSSTPSGAGEGRLGEKEKKNTPAASAVAKPCCQALYVILERLNSVVFLKQLLLID